MIVGQGAGRLRGVCTDRVRYIVCENEALSGVKVPIPRTAAFLQTGPYLIEEHESQVGRQRATQGRDRDAGNLGLSWRPRGGLSFTRKKRERSHGPG